MELYLSLAELLENQMQDPMQAISAYQSALQADPSSMEALTALDRLYRRHEMWEQLIDVLGRMADLKADPEDVVTLRLEIGELWDERLQDSGAQILGVTLSKAVEERSGYGYGYGNYRYGSQIGQPQRTQIMITQQADAG